MILSLLLSLVFILLGLIHLNWATGGTFGFKSAIPTKETGEPVLHPKKIDSAIIGVGLLAFAVFYILKAELIPTQLPDWLLHYGGYIIPSIFVLRAIGDFKYIGFFKKVKHTTFGTLDTKFFAPLCLSMGIIGFLIQFLG